MSKLRFSLSHVSERGIDVDVVVPATELQPEHAEEMAVTPVSVAGALSEVKKEYLFKGRVSGAYVHTCDRCLDEAEIPFAIDVLWIFTRDAGSGPLEEPQGGGTDNTQREVTGADLSIVDREIDLAPRTWEEIVLAAPSKFLCSQDCAGLCQHCGANLNRESCACGGQKRDANLENKGLAGLNKLFPDPSPNRAEG